MRTTLIVIALAASVLAACSKSSPPPSSAASQAAPASSAAAPAAVATQPSSPQAGDAVSRKLKEVAGGGATDCGRVRTQTQDETQKATDCAVQAAKSKHAFYVGYDMPGLSVGYAGNAQGKLFSVQAEDGPNVEAKSAPCPAELRVAQSGRITCMSPGSMGSGANPHGGAMPPATGANPHSGGGMISMPDLGGTQTPATSKSKQPPPGKTPPKE